ncbi:hypothetical protein GOP47_0012037 [Adiantum capillus-veneris]|uniref:Uncharacterized protein n=1 Tax=Adiantum capillus-veneris TaxID=13818 RepID=A0A9D4UUF0_ADICA|nr:hypothetical protein GOP47_0012037 [Adiantum capillus-veneris]
MSSFLCTIFTPPLPIPSTSSTGPSIDKEGLLAKIENTRFDRGGLYGSGVVGLKPFFTGKIPLGFETVYSPQELEKLQQLQSTDRDVEARMTVKITDHYLNLALQSESLMNLVKARPEETRDLSGSVDPSNQNKYSPVPGLLHKYEMVLLFVAGHVVLIAGIATDLISSRTRAGRPSSAVRMRRGISRSSIACL